jgi:hypothetical protein
LATCGSCGAPADGKAGTDTYGQFLADDSVHIAPKGLWNRFLFWQRLDIARAAWASAAL